jgi:hypothetical protein
MPIGLLFDQSVKNILGIIVSGHKNLKLITHYSKLIYDL